MSRKNHLLRAIVLMSAGAITATSALLSATASSAGTVSATCRSSLEDGTNLAFDQDTVERTTDEIISGPLDFGVSCRGTVFASGVTLASQTKINSISDFGASSSTYVQEGSDGLDFADGSIRTSITRSDTSITEIPYTISELSLRILQFSEAEVYFNFQIIDPQLRDPGTTFGRILREVEGNFHLSARGELDINATDQAGFEAAFTENSDVPIFVDGSLVFDVATYEAVINGYTNAIDISDLSIGKEYLLNYYFSADTEGRIAQATFQDPINFSGGGIDPVVLAQLTDSTVPLPTDPPAPSAVPLPAGMLLILTGLTSLCVGRSRMPARRPFG